MPTTCAHTERTNPDVKPSGNVCEECSKIGQGWNELRVCMTCGHVGCCETSKGKHAKKHFEETGHPIAKPLGTGEDWTWCYLDKNYVTNA